MYYKINFCEPNKLYFHLPQSLRILDYISVKAPCSYSTEILEYNLDYEPISRDSCV